MGVVGLAASMAAMDMRRCQGGNHPGIEQGDEKQQGQDDRQRGNGRVPDIEADADGRGEHAAAEHRAEDHQLSPPVLGPAEALAVKHRRGIVDMAIIRPVGQVKAWHSDPLLGRSLAKRKGRSHGRALS